MPVVKRIDAEITIKLGNPRLTASGVFAIIPLRG
jgi:hypothetical protein